MAKAIAETERRRRIQMEYNKAHGIVPRSIKKSLKEVFEFAEKVMENKIDYRTISKELEREEIEEMIRELEKAMYSAASELDFEKAAQLRDQIKELKEILKKKTVI
jgi:excinuclease ABC subunit B